MNIRKILKCYTLLLPNKLYAYFLYVVPSNSVFLKTHNTDSDETIMTFTD